MNCVIHAYWRKVRDLNPRTPLTASFDFKSSAFNQALPTFHLYKFFARKSLTDDSAFCGQLLHTSDTVHTEHLNIFNRDIMSAYRSNLTVKLANRIFYYLYGNKISKIPWYEISDLNRYDIYYRKILSLLCLPIPPISYVITLHLCTSGKNFFHIYIYTRKR